MKWVLLSLALALATHLWLCFRVSRSSTPLAIVTFFIGPLGALYPFFKHRGDDESSISTPFLLNLVCWLVFAGMVVVVALPLLEEQNAQLEALVSGPAPAPAVRASAPASASISIAPASSAASDSASSSLPAVAAASSVVQDPVEAFSQALKVAGLVHVVTRMPATTPLPAGVAEATLFSVSPMPAVGAASAASAPAPQDYAVTLFRCETAAACRNLAGTHLHLGGSDKRRVLQNGLLLLSTPPWAAESDLTPAAVASAFRKLQY